MNKFRLGDRVLVNGEVDTIKFKNERGRIIYFSPKGKPPIQIYFDRQISGVYGKKWFVYEFNLTKEARRDEIIYE